MENQIRLEIEKLRAESNERMNQMENQIRLEIEKIRAESNERTNRLESQIKLETEKLRSEMEIKLQAMKNSLLKWIIGLILGQTIAILIAITLK
jgi:F0F1-type ATP synthase membrane subunit b/b'